MLIIVFSALRMFSNFSSALNSLYSKASFIFLSLTMLYFFFTLTLLNYLLDQYSDFYYISNGFVKSDIAYCIQDKLIDPSALSSVNFEVYLYPFIYVFLLVTVLSIVFCLTYNQDELYSFMFYCTLILMSGYTLFFTDSMILFFFAYEMLLVPSFFILYKFAKTRRCVEAAYLMFFWTQFGALFLIIALLYLFFLTGDSSFSNILNTYMSTFEVNFIFVCLVFGFGVKLPI